MREFLVSVAGAAIAMALAGAANAQPTAAQILDANHAAMGASLDGQGAIDLRWSYGGQGLSGEVRSTYDIGGGGFVDTQDLSGTTGASGFDGKTAWWKDASGAVTPEA